MSTDIFREVLSNAGSRTLLMERLSTVIDRGDLGPGYRLPTERDISAMSGLSRSTIRKILFELEQSGRITREIGRGTFVAEAGNVHAGSELAMSPAELMEMRATLEPNLAGLLVSKAGMRDLDSFSRLLHEGARVRTWQDQERVDADFHDLFYRATHNPGMDHLADLVRAARRQQTWLNLKRSMFSLSRWREYQTEHEQIVEHLHARDAKSLKQAMFTHLTHVQDRII